MPKNKLWTKNFTTITISTAISMLGSSMSGFAVGIMVLDYTNSVLLYAVFSVLYTLPMIICPIIAGPWLDSISRKKAIYILDFFSAVMYAALSAFLYLDVFNYTILAIMALILGCVDSTYMVAYESLYPNIVPEGKMSKAYSISSMIYPLVSLMVPFAAFVYDKIGVLPIFVFNAVASLVAGIMETRIDIKETHVAENNQDKSFSRYIKDLKEGLAYLASEKGLMIITAYFFVSTLTGSASSTLILPYFKSNENLGVQLYTFVMGAALIGRLVGGGFHYLKKLPVKYKFFIALCVYFTITVIDASYLFLPVTLMIILNFTTGMLGVTSYNIRISATQNYIPAVKRARFNGVFQMLTALGGIVGQLIAGGLGDQIATRPLVVGFMAFNMLAVFFIMAANAKHVKKIYNVDI